MKIRDNEMMIDIENWDVECVGPNITIRNGRGDIALALEMHPPSGISVTSINMQFNRIHLRGARDLLEVSSDGVRWMRLQSVSMRHCLIGINYANDGINPANDPIY
ncbi:MAG: hypothetical protein V4801_10585 [Burkholderia gladioli]